MWSPTASSPVSRAICPPGEGVVVIRVDDTEFRTPITLLQGMFKDERETPIRTHDIVPF